MITGTTGTQSPESSVSCHLRIFASANPLSRLRFACRLSKYLVRKPQRDGSLVNVRYGSKADGSGLDPWLCQ